jgi:hypothetical protein
MEQIESKIRRAIPFLVLVVLSAVGLPRVAASQSSVDKAAGEITEIRLERNCFGCPTGSNLVLRWDGPSTYTITGSARQGAPDVTFSIHVTQQDFTRLARLVVTQRFFALKEEYGDSQQEDGPWSAITVVRNGEARKVFRHEHAGPHNLEILVNAVAAMTPRNASEK